MVGSPPKNMAHNLWESRHQNKVTQNLILHWSLDAVEFIVSVPWFYRHSAVIGGNLYLLDFIALYIPV